MRRHADVVQTRHEVFGQAVVQHAFAFNHIFLLRVKGCGVIFEILHNSAGLWAFIDDFSFAFVYLLRRAIGVLSAMGR